MCVSRPHAGPAASRLWLCGQQVRHGGLVQVAIDLGAAPGAWTELLASTGADTVFAVDPAELSEQCRALPNVVHVQRRSSEAVPAIQKVLHGRRVDIIVCDMNMLPQECAPCIAPLLPLLAPGGHVILTCKFSGNGRERCVRAHADRLPRGLAARCVTSTYRIDVRCHPTSFWSVSADTCVQPCAKHGQVAGPQGRFLCLVW